MNDYIPWRTGCNYLIDHSVSYILNGYFTVCALTRDSETTVRNCVSKINVTFHNTLDLYEPIWNKMFYMTKNIYFSFAIHIDEI